MSQAGQNAVDHATIQAITSAIKNCYESLYNPNFQEVSEKISSKPYATLIESLASNGVKLDDTTDINDDVSVQVVAEQSGNYVALELSGVGPFAVVRQLEADGRSRWVTRPDDAPTPLAKMVATAVARAGFQLLDRSTATRKISVGWWDGSSEVTLYRALFTDTDIEP